MDDPVGANAETRRQRLRAAFDAVVELPAAARSTWLAENLADAQDREQVLRLLRADDAQGFLDTPATEHAARAAARELRPDGLIGLRIGDFRVTRELGQGGMASVFLAEREGADFRQQVAIKLLRRGLYSELEQRLFQRERRALALLEHPHVARLIDGGVTEAGIPYLVMEYIDGMPITAFADERGLDVDARLSLFCAACDAVEAAHRSLIVHRDIKPSNILVSRDGVVKLLDFGIAKLIGDETDTATTGTRGVFTPDYAAPEQLRGDAITTATDVYGLGVLLHELLLGQRPDGSPTRRPSSRVEALALPQARVPALAAARLRKRLRGDLDNILLKALAEEPARRYPSAGALALDIARHREGRPISAHPPSRLYRTRKFVQRHRGGVAVTALLVVGILAALGTALWQARVARAQAQRANLTRDFLLGVFDAARARLPREQRPTPEMLVEAAQRRLERTVNLDDASRAELLRTLGQVELSLASFPRARQLLGEAAALEPDPVRARDDRIAAAQARQRAGDNAGAIANLESELAMLPRDADAQRAAALSILADARLATGAVDAALDARRSVAALLATRYGAGSADALAARLQIGNSLATTQQYAQAVDVLEPALRDWRRSHAPEDDRYVAALDSLATAQDGVGRLADAEARFRELLGLKQRIYTAPHDAIAATLRDLAQIVARAERYAQAEDLLAQALAMDRKVYGDDDHLPIALDFEARGVILVAQRRFEPADAAYRAALEVCTRARIRDEVCPRARNNLGMSLYRQNKLDEARQAMTQALAERRAIYGPDHPTVAYSLSTLANLAAKQDDAAGAARMSRQALEILERGQQADTRSAALIRFGYAQALWMQDANADALQEIDRALADWQRQVPDGKARRVAMLVQRAQILHELKRDGEARDSALQAIALDVPAAELSDATRALLRELSGRADAYPQTTQAPAQ